MYVNYSQKVKLDQVWYSSLNLIIWMQLALKKLLRVEVNLDSLSDYLCICCSSYVRILYNLKWKGWKITIQSQIVQLAVWDSTYYRLQVSCLLFQCEMFTLKAIKTLEVKRTKQLVRHKGHLAEFHFRPMGIILTVSPRCESRHWTILSGFAL